MLSFDHKILYVRIIGANEKDLGHFRIDIRGGNLQFAFVIILDLSLPFKNDMTYI